MQAGEALREARLGRGLDLYEVKRVTKISVPALRAMEEDRWDDLPAPGPQALLETYADFLGLDPSDLEHDERTSRLPRPSAYTRSVLLVVAVAAAVGLVIGLIGVGSGGSNGHSHGGASGGPSAVR